MAPALGVTADALVASGGRIQVKDTPSKGLSWTDACKRIGPQPITAEADWQPGMTSVTTSGVQFAEARVDVKTGIGKVTREGEKTTFTPDPAGQVIQVSRQDDDRISRAVHGLMRSLSVPGLRQVRPACLPCVLCHGRGGAHQGHGAPELIATVGGNEWPMT